MKKNETKRNTSKRNLLLVALLLLVAVFTFGGYTLSKYISTESSDSSATVAKWGYTITADASGLFGTDYTNATIVGDGTGVSVSSADADKVVAPGTAGSMSYKVTGTPEVASAIKVSFADSTDLKLVGNSEEELVYRPIVWTAKIDAKVADSSLGDGTISSQKTLEELETAINTKLEALGLTKIAPNKKVEVTITISWSWAFDNNNACIEGSLAGSYNSDQLDTIIAKDSEVGYAKTELLLKSTCTVEQIKAAQ